MRLRLGVAVAATALACVATAANVASAASPPTSHNTVHPVSTAGYVQAGWTALHESGSIDCSSVDPSPVAVHDDIDYCSPSAAYAVACWRGHDGVHALCLFDAVHKKLARYILAGPFAATHKTADPIPFRMTLGDGTYCKVRDGGAGARLDGHPNWFAVYYCNNNLAVWAPQGSDGVNRSTSTWTVYVAPADGHGALATKRVAAATFAGTA